MGFRDNAQNINALKININKLILVIIQFIPFIPFYADFLFYIEFMNSYCFVIGDTHGLIIRFFR